MFRPCWGSLTIHLLGLTVAEKGRYKLPMETMDGENNGNPY